jgi:hypothetical protein
LAAKLLVMYRLGGVMEDIHSGWVFCESGDDEGYADDVRSQ